MNRTKINSVFLAIGMSLLVGCLAVLPNNNNPPLTSTQEDGPLDVDLPSSAQTKVWNKTWGGAGYDAAYDLWTNGTNLFVVGTTDLGAPANDFNLINWDMDGNLVWNKTWGGAGEDYGEYICGNGTSLYTFGESNSFGGGGNYNLTLIKWDVNGTQIWNTTWGGTGDEDSRGIWGQGDYVYGSGTWNGWTGGAASNFTLNKWHANGTMMWNKTWGGSGDDNESGIWGDGTYLYQVGSTESYGAGQADTALIKWDVNGTMIWNKTWGYDQYESENVVGGFGSDIYTSGYTNSWGAGSEDMTLVKWDAAGNVIWNRTWGGSQSESGTDIEADGSNIYVTGYTDSFGAGNYDCALVKWDVAGNKIWDTTWGGPDVDQGWGIWLVGNFIYMVGETSSYHPGHLDAELVKFDISESDPGNGDPENGDPPAEIPGYDLVFMFAGIIGSIALIYYSKHKRIV